MDGDLLMGAGRKLTKYYEKMYEALDYCVQYCDDHDDCSDCAFRDIRIDKTTECPIYVITTLKDCVERKILQKGEQIDWSQVKL